MVRIYSPGPGRSNRQWMLTLCTRFKPPKINPEESNIKNSENTALFLTSCFEYVLSGIVLNAGRPFRQPASRNCKSLGLPNCRAVSRLTAG